MIVISDNIPLIYLCSDNIIHLCTQRPLLGLFVSLWRGDKQVDRAHHTRLIITIMAVIIHHSTPHIHLSLYSHSRGRCWDSPCLSGRGTNRWTPRRRTRPRRARRPRDTDPRRFRHQSHLVRKNDKNIIIHILLPAVPKAPSANP